MQGHANQWDGDGDFDLGRWLGAARRRWRLLVAGSVVAIAAALAYTVLAPPRYDANAAVLLTAAKYKVTLDPKFTTVDQSTAVQAGGAGRVEEFRTIILSREVTDAAKRAVQAGPGELLGVTAKVVGDAVQLTASARSPSVAARWANSYAAAAAQRLNAVYGGPDQDVPALQSKLAEAVASRARAEEALAAFHRANAREVLQRQIDRREALRQTILGQQNAVLTSRLEDRYATLTALDRLDRDAAALREAVAAGPESSAGTLTDTLALMALRARLQRVAPSAAAAAAPAVVSVGAGAGAVAPAGSAAGGGATGGQAQPGAGAAPPAALGSGTSEVPLGVPAQVRIDAPDLLRSGASREQLLAQADALSALIRSRKAAFAEDFRGVMGSLLQDLAQPGADLLPPGYRDPEGDRLAAQVVERLTNELLELRATLRQRDVEAANLQERLSLETTSVTSLDAKLQEATIGAGGRALVVASAAEPQVRASPPPLRLSIPLAVFVGLLVGVVAVVVRELALGAGGTRPEATTVRPDPSVAPSSGE